MAEAAVMRRRKPWAVLVIGLVGLYTVAHYLHATVGRTGYDDFLLLMRATREWLATGQFQPGYWYPPFFFLVNSPLALWFADDQTAARVMLGINHVLLAAGLWLLLVAARPKLSGRLWLWLLLPLALNFRPLLLLVSMAKIEMLQLVLLTGGLLAVQRGRPATGGVLVACSGMLKPLPILFLPYFIWTRQWRTVAAWAATVAAILALSGLVMGPEAVGTYFGIVVQPRGVNAIYWYEDQSLANLVVRLFHPIRPNEFYVPLSQVRAEGVLLGWGLRALTAGWLAWLLWPRRTAMTIERRWRDWSIVSAGMLLLSPMARDYYAVFLLPGYLLLAILLARLPRWWTQPAFWWGAVSYVLVGQGFPLGVIHHLPMVVPGVPNFQAYLHFGIPTLGYLCLIAAWAAWRRPARDDAT